MASIPPPLMDTSGSSEEGSEGEERPTKRLRATEQRDAADDDVPGSDDDSSSDEEDDSDVDVVGAQPPLSPNEREIQVEFEARSPQERDYFGLILLLRQMLKPSSVNMSVLADVIIRQREVGSVITQSQDVNDDTDEDSDDENAGALANGGGAGDRNFANGDEVPRSDSVFGVGTVIKLEYGANDSIGDRIVSHLLINTAKSPKATELRAFFNDRTKVPGFLVSERILNMPPQISVPMYETLLKELRKAVGRNLPFNFTDYVLISRQLVNPNDENTVIYTNAEEEVFLPECDIILDMECGGMPSTRSEPTSGGGRMFSSFTSEEYIEKRKLLVFKASKLERITSLMKNAFPIN